MGATEEITQLLRRVSAGDDRAVESLFPLVYEQLHSLARVYFRGEPADHTWQPTALVHEAYLRLAQRERPNVRSRREFFAVAAQAMRRLLVDHARRRRRLKRRPGERLGTDVLDALQADDTAALLLLDEGLEELGQVDAQAHQVVMLRYFAGLSVEQAAEVLDVSSATVKRNWVFAKAWLARRLAHAEL